jgi:hypothetical protein
MTRLTLLAIVCCALAIGGHRRHPGLEDLETRAYSPTLLDPVIFDNLWRSWDPASKEAAEKASATDRRAQILKRYGLLEAPYDNGGAPLGMLVQKDGTYTMNCLICHAGAVAGETILGLPNSALEFSGLFEDIASTVTLMHGSKPGNPPFPQGLLFMSNGKPATSVQFPEGSISATRGTTNSFTFSVFFLAQRGRDLDKLDAPLDLKPHTNYLDPPPWWHVAKKKAFYSDGFTPKSVRALMQFSLDPSTDPALFKSWEEDFKQVYAWLHTIESPKYKGAIDSGQAARGQDVYTQTCARCHGTPGPGGRYTNRVVPIDTVNTDRVRLAGLSPDFKQHFSDSWMGYYGETDVTLRARGYIAPPLDGIWASAPYFHNGSVPTLYHVLFPDERPVVWKVTDYGAYDRTRVGLQVDELARAPETGTLAEKRTYYDTSRESMGNGGHRFADKLTREQRLSLLEYLKSL